MLWLNKLGANVGKEKTSQKNVAGLLGCLGLPVLLFGLYYAAGSGDLLFCLEASCTLTVPVGGGSIFIGAILIFSAIVIFRSINSAAKRISKNSSSEPTDGDQQSQGK